MIKRFIVVDQGYYRDPRLERMIADQPEITFVVPDTAFVEMSKSEQWESTMRRSLEYLSTCPSRVRPARSIGELLRFEGENKRSANGRLFFREFTPVIRNLLYEIRTGKDGGAFKTFRAKVAGIRSELSEEELNYPFNLIRLRELTNIATSSLGDEIVKRLKDPETTPAEVAKSVFREGPGLMLSFFQQVGFPPNRVRAFIDSKPLTYRFVLLRYWLALDWARLGGLDSLPEKKATNEFLDQDYVLLASFFDGLLSKDDRVNRADAALRMMLAM